MKDRQVHIRKGGPDEEAAPAFPQRTVKMCQPLGQAGAYKLVDEGLRSFRLGEESEDERDCVCVSQLDENKIQRYAPNAHKMLRSIRSPFASVAHSL